MDHAPSSTAPRSGTSWASRSSCRRGRSSEPEVNQSRTSSATISPSFSVGSEGTLAIVTQVILRLVPRPVARAILRATFHTVDAAVRAVGILAGGGVVPAALELIDAECLAAIARYDGQPQPSADTAAVLLIEVDGMPEAVAAEAGVVTRLCAPVAMSVHQASTDLERDRLWDERRRLSLALRAEAPRKINHDVVVPKGRIPQLFSLIARLQHASRLPMPSFGHIGDGNIHVNILVDRMMPTRCSARAVPKVNSSRESSPSKGLSVASMVSGSQRRRSSDSSFRQTPLI